MEGEISDAVETIENAEQEAQQTAGDVIDDAYDTASDVVESAHDTAADVIDEAQDTARDLHIHGRIDAVEARLQALEGNLGDAVGGEPTVVEVHHEPPAEPPAEPPEEPEIPLDVGQDEPAALEPLEDDIAPNKRNRHWFYR
jgi:hypothetical protein